jgi:phosphotransferase system enzyme I (PtsI)
MVIKGISVSRGIAIGRAHKLERGQLEITETCIPKKLIDAEVARLRRAVDTAKNQLKQIRKKIPRNTPNDIADFIDAHLLMMSDSALSEAPEQIIRTQYCSAEWALKLQLDTLVSVFDEMDDAYLKTRRDDVIHVVNRILRILTNKEDDLPLQASSNPVKDKIIIADDLTPADIVLLQHQGMIAFITESGGPLSHTAILARSLNLPALVGVHYAKRYIRNDEEIIVDGDQGVALAAVSSPIKLFYSDKNLANEKYFSSLTGLKDKIAVTKDAVRIKLCANAELPEDISALSDIYVDGIGLFRSEYLFMNRDSLPDEEEQYIAYKKMIASMNGQPVTIRTLDLGADKKLKSMQYHECPTNPALGLRAIRLCLNDSSLFMPQLRAILRASAHGSVRMMIPMLTNTQEVLQVKAILKEIKSEFSRNGVAFDMNMPVGGMIEVPAAAISAHLFARHLDFLSIGTNDLIQYTLAIDRIDEDVNYLYQPSHPSVLQLIHKVLQAGVKAGIPVAMCGEMAGDPDLTRLLLGLGLREFSMQTNALLEVKNIINHSSIKKLGKTCNDILKCEHADEINHRIEKLNSRKH